MKKTTAIIIGSLLLAACNAQPMENDVVSHDEISHGVQSHDSMTMEQMTDSLEGKTGDELDKAFIEAMIPHHEGAVDMAEMILNNAAHQELRTMAAEIIRAQEAEITLMKEWYTNWGYGSL